MTEAQRAHLHLMETLPRERIHTHEYRPRRVFKGHHKAPDQIPRSVLKQRRTWLRRNAHRKTRYEICAALGMRHDSVCRTLKNMGLTPAVSERDGKSMERRQWIEANAASHTSDEIAQILDMTRASIRYHLQQLGIRCKPAR